MKNKIVRKDREERRFVVNNVPRMCWSAESLMYNLTEEDRLQKYIEKESSPDNPVVCVSFEELKISNYEDIIKVTNTLYGFENNKVLLNIGLRFIRLDGSDCKYYYDFEFKEYGGFRGKSKESLKNKYEGLINEGNKRFYKERRIVCSYEKLRLNNYPLDVVLNSLIKDGYKNTVFYIFNPLTKNEFIKNLVEKEKRDYIIKMEKCVKATAWYMTESEDAKLKTRLNKLNDRFDKIFYHYKERGYEPVAVINGLPIYKHSVSRNRDLFFNGFTLIDVEYGDTFTLSNIRYDIASGSSVEDCIKVLESYAKSDEKGVLDMIKVNINLKKKEVTEFNIRNRRW